MATPWRNAGWARASARWPRFVTPSQGDEASDKSDGSHTLSWVASGPHAESGVAFARMDVVLYDAASARLPRRKDDVVIGRSGSVRF